MVGLHYWTPAQVLIRYIFKGCGKHYSHTVPNQNSIFVTVAAYGKDHKEIAYRVGSQFTVTFRRQHHTCMRHQSQMGWVVVNLGTI